jgi:hypothetical protein
MHANVHLSLIRTSFGEGRGEIQQTPNFGPFCAQYFFHFLPSFFPTAARARFDLM